MAKRKEPEIFDTEQDEPEFHFADEDETPVFAEEAHTQAGPGFMGRMWNRLKKQRLLLVILILVVVYCVYQVGEVVTNWFHTPKEQLVPASPPSGPSTADVQYQAQQAAQKAQSLSTGLSQVQQSQQAVSTRLASLEQDRTASTQLLNTLQAQVAQNTKQIQAIQTQLYGIDKSLLMLAERLQTKSTAPAPAKKDKPVIPVYYVKAIVPGRAWLSTQGGAVITVAPGDTVPSYGRVTNIDPDSGTVGTTSGKTIRFGINEN